MLVLNSILVFSEDPKGLSDMGENTDGWIATFSDPDGNYFQLMTPWEV